MVMVSSEPPGVDSVEAKHHGCARQVIVASGLIAYLGAFTPDFREGAVSPEAWHEEYMQNRGLNNENRVWGMSYYNYNKEPPKPYSNYQCPDIKCIQLWLSRLMFCCESPQVLGSGISRTPDPGLREAPRMPDGE